MKNFNKLKPLLLLLTVLISASLFLLPPKPAYAQFVVHDPIKQAWDAIQKFAEKAGQVLKEHSALMWKQAQLYFGTKLAKDAAVMIASGNPGQMMMFVTDTKEYWGDLADATAGEYLDSLSQNVFGKSLCQPSDINKQIQTEIGIRSFLSGLKGQLTNVIPNMCEEMCQHLAPAKFTGGARCDTDSGKEKQGKLCTTDNECRPGKCVSDFSETASSGAGASASVKSAFGIDPSLTAQIDQYNSSAKKLMTQVLDIEKKITKGVGENIWENVRRDIYPYEKQDEPIGIEGGICDGKSGADLDQCCTDNSSQCTYNKYYNYYCHNIDFSMKELGVNTLNDYYDAIQKGIGGVGIEGNGESFTNMLRALFKIESSSEKSKIQAFCGAFNDPIIPDFIIKIIKQDAWTTDDQKMALGILYLRYAANSHDPNTPGPFGPLGGLFGAFKANEILIKSGALNSQYVDIWPLLDFLLTGVNKESGQLEKWSPVQYDLNDIHKQGDPETIGGDIINYLYQSTAVLPDNTQAIHIIIFNQIDIDSPIFALAEELYNLESEIGELDEGFFEAMDNYNTCIMMCEKGEVKVPKNKCLATDILGEAQGRQGMERLGISGVNVGLTLDNVKVGDYGYYCAGGSRDWYPCSSDGDCQPGGTCQRRYVKSDDLRKIQQIASDITNNTAGLGRKASGEPYDINVWRNMAEFSSYFEPGNNPVGQLLTAVQESQEKSAGAKAQEEIERQSSGLLSQKSTVSGRRQLPPEAGMSRLERNLASLREANNQYTGSVLAQMWGVFANTLIQKLEEKLYSKGLNPQTFGGPFEGAPRDSLGTGRAVAEAQFTEFSNPEITVSSNPIQVLAVLTNGCEKNLDKRAYNECIIKSNWQEAISQKLSLADAVNKNKKNLIKEDLIFGYQLDKNEPKLEQGLPYSSMLVLRKYRIIPSSWELAAKYGLYELENDNRHTALTLGEVMYKFNEPSSPYYKLVDPNWVLKAPQFQCARQGAGEVIISETPEVFQPSEDVIPKVVVARADSCGDEQSCVRESADGQQCEKYGYCIREKNTWRFGTNSCDPMFNTCRTYQGPIVPGQKNEEVNYLESTLEQAACAQTEAKGCQEYRRDYRAIAPIFNFQFSIFNYSPRQFTDEFGLNNEFDDTYDFFNDPDGKFIENIGKAEEEIKDNYQSWTPDPAGFLDNSIPNPDGFLTKVPTLWKCTRITGESCYFERIAGREEGCDTSSNPSNPSTPSPLKCTPWLEFIGDDDNPRLQRNIDNSGVPQVSIERVFGENRYWCGLPGGAGCFVSDVQNIKTPLDMKEIIFIDKDGKIISSSQAGSHTTTEARRTCVVVGTKIDFTDPNNPLTLLTPLAATDGKPLTCTLGDPLHSRALLNTPVLQDDGKPICDENSAGCQEFTRISFKSSVYLSDEDKLKMLGKLLEKGKDLAAAGDSKSYDKIFADRQFTQIADNLPIQEETDFTVESIYLNNKRVMCQAEDVTCREIRTGDFAFAAKINPRRDMCPADCAGYNSFLALPTPLEDQLTPEKNGVLNYFVPEKEENRKCDLANEGCEIFSESSGTDITKTTLHYFNKVAMCVIQNSDLPTESISGLAKIETYRTIDGTEGFEPKSWRLVRSDMQANESEPLAKPLDIPIKDYYGNNIKYGDVINEEVKVINQDDSLVKDGDGNLVKQFGVYNGPCIKFTYTDNPDNLACADASDSQILSNALSSCLQFNTKEETPENSENPDRLIAVVEFKDSEPNCREFLYFNQQGEAESYPLPQDKVIRAVDNTQVQDAASQCKPYIRERTRKAYNLVRADSELCSDGVSSVETQHAASLQVACRRYQGFELAPTEKVFVNDFQSVQGELNFEGWQKQGGEEQIFEITQGINVGDQALHFSSAIRRGILPEELVYNPTIEAERKNFAGKEYTLSFWVKPLTDKDINLTFSLMNCLDADCESPQNSAGKVGTIPEDSAGLIQYIGPIVARDEKGNSFIPNRIQIILDSGELLIDHIILKQQTDLFLIEPQIEKGEFWAVPPQCDLNLGRICKAGASYVANCPADYCCGLNYDDEDETNDFSDPENIKTTQDKCLLPENPQSEYENYCELPFTAVNDKGTIDNKDDDEAYVLDTPQQILNYIGCESYTIKDYQTEGEDIVWKDIDIALTIKNFGELCDLEKVGCTPLINTFNTAGALSAVYNKNSGDILSYNPNNPNPPKIFTPEDTIEFWAFDAEVECDLEQKSCAYLAKPEIDINYQVAGLTPVIVKDNPADYETNQVSSLCYLAQNQCRAYNSGAGEVVFKNPGNKICEYRKGSLSSTPVWYKKSTADAPILSDDSKDKKYRSPHYIDTLCPLQDFTDKDSNIKTSRPKGVCVDGYGTAILKSDGSVYQCDYWVENRPDLPKEKKDRTDECKKLIKDNLLSPLPPQEPIDCSPISAFCSKDQSMCAEIRDPKASGIEKSFFVINDSNKLKSCGSVDDEAGCKLFADTSLKNQSGLTALTMRADKTEKDTAGNTDCNSPSCYNIYGDESSDIKQPSDPSNPSCSYDKMCDSNKIIKVERDRVCGEWLECTSSIQLAPESTNSEPLCLARKPCDQWGTDDTCAHFVEDAVNVFNSAEITEDEYKAPTMVTHPEAYGGSFNKNLQTRLNTISGFSKTGMEFSFGQCSTDSPFNGKLCYANGDCFAESGACVPTEGCSTPCDPPDRLCCKEDPVFKCQEGTPKAGGICGYSQTGMWFGSDLNCYDSVVVEKGCSNNSEYKIISGLNAFSSSDPSIPIIKELGDISLVKNGGFEEIDGAEEDTITLDDKEKKRRNQRVLKPRYWLPGCKDSYSLECSKESPASAMTIVSRYERGKSQPHRVKDDQGRFLVKEGNISLMLGSNQTVKQRIDGVRSPGKYVLSAWVKNETASQAGLAVTQYDRGDSTSAIGGSVHSTTCFKFTGNYSEFESKNDSYDNCLFVDKPTDGWQFVSKLINIESIADLVEATMYITVELFNNSGGYIYFDEVQLRPHLIIEGEYKDQDGARYSNVKFTGPACRLYAAEDALSCDARDEKGSYRRGWRGYCLEWKGDQCLNWWPVDMITGEANAIGAIENAGYAGPAPLYYCAESRDKNLPPKIKMPRLVCLAKNSPTDLDYEGCKIVALVSDPKPEFYDLKEGDWKLGVDANNFGTDSDIAGYAVRYVKAGGQYDKPDEHHQDFAGGLCLWMDVDQNGKVTTKEFSGGGGIMGGDDKEPNCLNGCFAVQGLGAWDANIGVKVFNEGKNGENAYAGCEWTKTGSNWRACGEKLEQAYHKVAYFVFSQKNGNIGDGGDNEMGCKPAGSTDKQLSDGNGDRIYRPVIADFKYQGFCSSPFCFGDEEASYLKIQNDSDLTVNDTEIKYYQNFDNFGSIYLLSSIERIGNSSYINISDADRNSLEGRLSYSSKFYNYVDQGWLSDVLSVTKKGFAVSAVVGAVLTFGASLATDAIIAASLEGLQRYLDAGNASSDFPFIPHPLPRETRPQQCRVLSKVVDESGDNKAWAQKVHNAGDNLAAPLLFDFNKQCVLPGAVSDKKVGYGALPYITSPVEITMTPTNQETFDEQAEVRTAVEFFHVNNPENNKKNEAKMCKETYHAGNAFYACGDACSVCVGGGPNNHGKICYADTDCGAGVCGRPGFVCSGGSKDKYNCQLPCNKVVCDLSTKHCVVKDDQDKKQDKKIDLGKSCSVDKDCDQAVCENYKCIYYDKGGNKFPNNQSCPNSAGQTGNNKDCSNGLCIEVPNDKDKVLIKNERAFEAPAQGMSRLQNLFAKGYGAYLWTPSNEPSDIEDSKSSGFEIGQYTSIKGEWDITQIINTCSTAGEKSQCAETAGCQLSACVPVSSLGDYEECVSRGDKTCINDCIKDSTTQDKLTTCLDKCYTQTACCGKADCKDDGKCAYKSSLVCSVPRNPYPQIINIAVEDKKDTTIEIKPEHDHTVELSFGITANQNQLPIKEIYIDWGDGETTTLGGIAWNADEPNPASFQLRKFLHTYRYHTPQDPLPDGSGTYMFTDVDPRCKDLDKTQCVANPFSVCSWDNNAQKCNSLWLCANDNCLFRPRLKVVDNWGWCNGDETGGVMGYYKDDCYYKNSIPNENAWDYFAGTVKILNPKE